MYCIDIIQLHVNDQKAYSENSQNMTLTNVSSLLLTLCKEIGPFQKTFPDSDRALNRVVVSIALSWAIYKVITTLQRIQ